MRMSELEKLAFGKEADWFSRGLGVLDPVVRGGIKALELGAQGGVWSGGKVLKGVGHALKIPAYAIGKSMEKAPVGTLAKAGIAAATVPGVVAMAGHDNYLRRQQAPINYQSAEQFGHSPWSPSLENYAEDRSMPKSSVMEELAKEAGIGTWAGNMAGKAGGVARDLGFGTASFLPKIILAAGGAGLLAKALGPTAQTFGEKIQKKVFSTSDRVNAPDEMEKARVTALGDLYARREIKTIKTKTDSPKISDVLAHIKSTDPFLGEAARDPKLKGVMQQTMNTVYTFAPDIAKDHRAMQSILTEAVTSPDGGLSFQTVKSLAETQRFINQGR